MITPAEDEQLSQFLREVAATAKRELNYPPNYFLSSLGSKGGYRTVVDLLAPGRPPSDGFIKLWEHGRVDLTVEALILESQWHRHFPEDVLQVARRRLRDVQYQVREPLTEVATEPAMELREPAPTSIQQRTALTTSRSEHVRAQGVWKITGPIENFLTAIQRGYWALNDKNLGAWNAIQEGDIVVFHSTRDSEYMRNPPSAIVGFARVGARKYRKEEHWWLAEIRDKANYWPNAFSLEDACLSPAEVDRIDFRIPFEGKTDAQRELDVRTALAGAYALAKIEEEARRLMPDVPHFPVNGSVARLSEVYRRAILSDREWVRVIVTSQAYDLESDLLSDEERAEISSQDRAGLLTAAQSYKDPAGPMHALRRTRVRMENARQKYRIACLEDFTCQVCGYRQGYVGKSGVQRWIIQVDHIVQKADQGGEAIGNLWVLCPTCHAEKTCGVLRIDPGSYDVTRHGKLMQIRNFHLPIGTGGTSSTQTMAPPRTQDRGESIDRIAEA